MKNSSTHSVGGFGTVPSTPGRPAVPLGRILEVALQLVDEKGADALTMRSLAQRLESSTATLYRHFDSRAELISQVADRVLGEAVLDLETIGALPWREACSRTGQAVFVALARHQNIAPFLAEAVPVGPNAASLRECLIGGLLNHGFTPKVAALAYATLARHILGLSMQMRPNSMLNAQKNIDLSQTFRSMSEADYPATRAVADHLPVELETEFSFGMALILNGLEQLKLASDPELPD